MAAETIEETRLRLIAMADERGDFVTDVDGFIYWWPSGSGHHSSHHLRWIADELDRRNKPWEDIIANDPRINGSAAGEETGLQKEMS